MAHIDMILEVAIVLFGLLAAAEGFRASRIEVRPVRHDDKSLIPTNTAQHFLD